MRNLFGKNNPFYIAKYSWHLLTTYKSRGYSSRDWYWKNLN